ncbi:Spo0E family sporulation regulatory protein-aspartic acid phosphatase [Neobacillus cucumis]
MAHPDLLEISRQLDKKIVAFQKIIIEIQI